MTLDQNDEVVKCLKACILSRKGGVPFRELNADYKELVGEDVPCARLGFGSLKELLCNVSGVSVDQQAGVVRTAPTAQTQHLHKLISKQKDKPKKQSKRYIPYRQGYPSRSKPAYGYRPPQPPLLPTPQRYQSYTETYHAPARPTYEPQHRVSVLERIPPQYRYVQYHRPGPYDRPRNASHPKNQRHYNDNNNNSCGMYPTFEQKERLKNCRSRASINGHTVIGDDHMMDLLGCAPTPLCDYGMTIKKAVLGVREHGCSDKVVIALGTVDILKGHTDLELVLDMKELIQTVWNTGARVFVCTLPPMPSVRYHLGAINSINDFNRWLWYSDHLASGIVDLNSKFKDGKHIKYELFQQPPKRIRPDCLWHMVGWNKLGRCLVEKELKVYLSSSTSSRMCG